MKMKKIPKLKSVRSRRVSKVKPVEHGVVTTKTVEQHRSEIIGRARKYIYPLRASKRRIIILSSSILAAAVIIFLTISGLMLYKFQSDSTFIYRVTQVVPFPVAKAGGSYIAYENYLFQVRHYVHYYSFRNQQPTDFSTKSGQSQLEHYKHQALEQVVDYAYTKQLARKYNVRVSRQDVDASLNVAKNRLGNNQQEFANVLQSFWGWSVSDYRRELSQELLSEKVASRLDTGAHAKADEVLAKLNKGGDFAELAKRYSDDESTKGSGGKYHELISKDNTDLPPEVVAAAFRLKPNEHSQIIDTGYSLEILKLLSTKNDKLELAHIHIDLAPISKYIAPLKKENPPTYFIDLKQS